MTKIHISALIEKGIRAIAKDQALDGSFISYSSPKLDNFYKSRKYSTVFSTALILSCLNSLDKSKIACKVKDSASTFLLSQNSEVWSYNYWARESKEYKQIPYPDDLDDTFCSLTSLYDYNKRLINGKTLAHIISLLTSQEYDEGGPYYTWLISDETDQNWKDIDIVVNSNIANFLTRININLPSIEKLIDSAIDSEEYTSPYYPSCYPVIYFISRWYDGKKKSKISKYLMSLRSKNHIWENQLNTALAVSSLLNLGTHPTLIEKGIEYISTGINKNIRPYSFCIDPTIDGKIHYAGSPALTTAFCIEALGKFEAQNKGNTPPVHKKTIGNSDTEYIYELVIKTIRKRFSTLEGDLKDKALVSLNNTINADKDKQIVLLPYYFTLCLGNERKKISQEMLVQLGLANLYGWIAYTIYDDFLDDKGDIKFLSVANVCLRELTLTFNKIFDDDSKLQLLFNKLMDKIDGANTWEVHNCRVKPFETKLPSIKLKQMLIPDYKDYSKLAERSIGHILGPLMILGKLGYKENSSEIKRMMDNFNNYLIARQLNDDAHDWQQDLNMGHINAIGAMILNRIKKEMIDDCYDISPSDLEDVFWHQIIIKVCHIMKLHIKQARVALKNNPIAINEAPLESIIRLVERSVDTTLSKHKMAKEFISEYEK